MVVTGKCFEMLSKWEAVEMEVALNLGMTTSSLDILLVRVATHLGWKVGIVLEVLSKSMKAPFL